MRRLTLLLAAAALTAAFALSALAAGPHRGRLHAHWLAGSVTTVSTDSVTVGVLWTGPRDGSLNGQSVTLAVDPGSRIISGRNRTPVALSSLQAGQLVGVIATGTGGDLTALTARRIHVRCNCHWIGGTIASTGTNTLTVQVERTGPYDSVLAGQAVKLDVDDATIVIKGKPKAPIGLSELATGESVGIVFSADGFFKAPGFDPAAATFTAKRIHAWGDAPVPSPLTDATSAAQVGA